MPYGYEKYRLDNGISPNTVVHEVQLIQALFAFCEKRTKNRWSPMKSALPIFSNSSWNKRSRYQRQHLEPQIDLYPPLVRLYVADRQDSERFYAEIQIKPQT